MDFKELSYRGLQDECKKRGIKATGKYPTLIKKLENWVPIEDNFTEDVLRKCFNIYKYDYEEKQKIIEQTGLPIRHSILTEEISENIAKFIIRNKEGDHTCKWGKAIKVSGDLYSEKYSDTIEVKAFTSDGPTSFGPDKKFGVIYFLDMRKWNQDIIILWKVNLTHNSHEFKNIKTNKNQTHQDQCAEGRRPRINWESLYPQISEHCEKIYEGTFDGIFINSLNDSQSAEQLV
jgi:hypothetical protein